MPCMLRVMLEREDLRRLEMDKRLTDGRWCGGIEVRSGGGTGVSGGLNIASFASNGIPWTQTLNNNVKASFGCNVPHRVVHGF